MNAAKDGAGIYGDANAQPLQIETRPDRPEPGQRRRGDLHQCRQQSLAAAQCHDQRQPGLRNRRRGVRRWRRTAAFRAQHDHRQSRLRPVRRRRVFRRARQFVGEFQGDRIDQHRGLGQHPAHRQRMQYGVRRRDRVRRRDLARAGHRLPDDGRRGRHRHVHGRPGRTRRQRRRDAHACAAKPAAWRSMPPRPRTALRPTSAIGRGPSTATPMGRPAATSALSNITT